MKTRKIAGIGMMIAVAFVLSYLESLIPINVGIPGVKLGMSNLVVIFCMFCFNPTITFLIAVIRIILCGITFGSMSGMLYSLAGGMLSFIVMLLLKKTERFSVCGVSVAGGVFHNVGQILEAMFVLQTNLLIYYLPFLIISGVVAGIIIGLIGTALIKRLKDIEF